MDRPTPPPWIAVSLGVAWGVIACEDAPDRFPPDANREVDADERITTGCGEPGATPDAFPCQCTAACQAGAECLTEATAIEAAGAGFPGGACLRFCSTAAGCDGGYTCVPVPGVPTPEGMAGICARHCDTNRDCPSAHSCTATLAGKLCVPRCQADADCDSGHCNRYDGSCTDGTEPAGGGIGTLCSGDSDCKSDFCFPGDGFCSALCSIERQGCPDGAVCFGDPGDDEGNCAVPCERDQDCAFLPGGVCAVVDRPAGERVCAAG